MSKVKRIEPEGFADFWAVWQPYMRHTDGRGEARDRYRKKVLEGAEPEEILMGAKAYIEHLKKLPPDERKFIPLAATWLNKESYSDWADRERLRQSAMAESSTNVVQMGPPAAKRSRFMELWDSGEIKTGNGVA